MRIKKPLLLFLITTVHISISICEWVPYSNTAQNLPNLTPTYQNVGQNNAQTFSKTARNLPDQALPKSDSNFINNGKCFISHCSQTITGRQLKYSRALEIIQDEEYLREANFDILRRIKRQTGSDTMKTFTSILSTNTGTVSIYSIIDQIINSLPAAQLCEILGQLNIFSPFTLQQKVANAGAICNEVDFTAFPSGGITVPAVTGFIFFTGGTTVLTNKDQCSAYFKDWALTFNLLFQHIYLRKCLINDFLEVAAPAGLVVGGLAVASLYASPALPMTLPSGVPPGNPIPGTPGGGAPPTLAAGRQTLTSALALVPAGLVPIALFPPYERPRTVPAVSVIFREDSRIQPLSRLRKRSLRRKLWRYFKSTSVYFDNLYYKIEAALEDFKYFLKKELTIEAFKAKIYDFKERTDDFKNNIKCLRTKLTYYAKQQMKKHYGYHHYRPRRAAEIINSMDDCFDFMEEPLYGFRTQITFDQRCSNNQCNAIISEQEFPSIHKYKQTGKEFASDAPPDCRITSTC